MINQTKGYDCLAVKISREIISRIFRVVLIFILIMSLCACATPIGVKKVELRDSYKSINANALSADEISSDTKVLLKRYNLLDRLDNDTAAVIALLHEKAL